MNIPPHSEVLEPKGSHRCQLPWQSGGYGNTGHPDGSLVVCRTCEQPWVARPCFESYGPTQKWHKVRWYHRRLRKRLKDNLLI